FIGTKGKLVAGLFGTNPVLFPVKDFKDYASPKKTIPRVKDGIEGHWNDWVRACKEKSKNRVEASSSFEYAGPLSESVVMGNLAIRLQGLNKKLKWDGKNMKVTNISPEDMISVVTSNKFTVIN